MPLRYFFQLCVACLTVTLCFSQPVRGDDAAAWIWLGDSSQNSEIYLRKTIHVPEGVQTATLVGTADNHITVFVNGHRVLRGNDWRNLEFANVTKWLKTGRNVLAVEAKNDDGPAGVFLDFRLVLKDGSAVDIVSDTSWKGSTTKPKDWQQLDFDDTSWQPTVTLGSVGDSNLPWSNAVNTETIGRALGRKSEDRFLPEVAAHITQREDFVVEKVFEVPRAMGSWVSLTKDNHGRLIASDQSNAGLFLITPGEDGKETLVEKLPVDLSGAQGMCWAFDSLYVVVNGGDKSGLHRLTDTDGDGKIDHDDFIMPFPGGGEHGPHAVIPGPDGKSLYLCAGNHTPLPPEITSSRIPQNWGEDHLLPRRWDANGHAAGVLAPGGWILKIDPEAKTREIISIGYRNEYDIAFNADGELFTYDADMEWDLGTPWYRPTRVCHTTSGSEFGWRSGTGKWPTYYEDSLPPVLNIGPGSPVGVVFGYGAKFPAKYQRALFILDWTYSTIYAVHLTPDGSTYSGETEDFVHGEPMQVTDAVIGDDGALYFTTGGRGTASALFRVQYTGNESTEPVDATNAAGAELRALRHQLEEMQGQAAADLDLIFKSLSHEDRFIRYAARVALESQPVEAWREQVLNQSGLSGHGATLGLMALARQGKPEDLVPVLESLEKIDFNSLDEQAQLALLRTYELAFIRLGQPDETWRQKLIETFDPMFPAQSDALNAELVQILVYLNSPSVVTKTLALMDSLEAEPAPDWGYLVERSRRYGGTVGKLLSNMPPARAVHFAFVLRNQKEGWTLPQREKYFQFFIDASKYPGGNSYGKFLSQFREDALQTCSPEERVILEPITSVSLLAAPPKVDPPKGPGRKWTKDEILATVDGQLKKQNFERGRNLFFAVNCAKCHRLNGEGGSIGPDLSTAGKKFPLPDLIDSILEPSKVISDQYASQQVITVDGQVIQGRAMPIGEELHIYTPNPDTPPVILKKSDVEEVQPSKLSQMPVGLIDSLNPDELKDLMAYLISGADRRSEVYR